MTTNLELAQRLDETITLFETLLAGQILLPVQTYKTETADADPGPGNFRLNAANLADVTEAYFDDQDSEGTSIEAFLATYDDSASVTKGTLVLKSLDNPSNFAAYAVTGAVADGNGYSKVSLTHIFSNGTWLADEMFGQQFYRAGDPGAASALAAGTITTLEPGQPVSVVINGTAPNQIVDIGIPKGDTGDTGPPSNIQIGTVTIVAPDEPAQAVLTGTAPNYVLNLAIPQGYTGDQGEIGFGFVYGSGPPDDNADGRNGDTYLDRDNGVIYPRKVSGAWPSGVNLKGDKGDKGDTGDTPPGWYFSGGVPDAAAGELGWMAYDFIGLNVYGPKTEAGWGVATPLKGESGDGSGDVTGPSSAGTNNIAVYNSSTGKVLKDSGITIDEVLGTLGNLGPLAKARIQDLTSDLSIEDPVWLEHDGLAAHTVTISDFAEGDAIVVADPDLALPDFTVTLVSRVEGAERLTNATLSGVGVDIDYGADGIHRVPTGWAAENPGFLNPSGWSISNGVVQFEVTSPGGGMSQAGVFEIGKRHKISGRARKVSGDAAATLNAVVTSNSIGNDTTEIIPAGDESWIEFELDAQPGVDAIAFVCQAGVAVWEIDRVSVTRYAQFWLGPEAHSDTLTIDKAGNRGFVYRADKERFVKI